MPYEGRCTCGAVQFKLNAEPLMVHACHCTRCQRVTGTAFVMNAVIEKSKLELVSGEPASAHFEGTTHTAYYCGDCGNYVWSQYAGLGSFWFVRVGVLDDRDSLPPDVHIYTSTKQPWMVIPDGVPRFNEFYDLPTFWSKENLARLEAAG